MRNTWFFVFPSPRKLQSTQRWKQS